MTSQLAEALEERKRSADRVIASIRNEMRADLLHRLAWAGVGRQAQAMALFVDLYRDGRNWITRTDADHFFDHVADEDVPVVKSQLVGFIDFVDPGEGSTSPESKSSLRSAAIHWFGQQCSYCECLGTSCFGPDGRPWCLDRIIPGAVGGKYAEDNVTLSCWGCNSRRGASPIEKRIFSLSDRVAANMDWLYAWSTADLSAWEAVE